MKKNNMKVADFFCGAGGFSEGFRQAGYNIVFALDKWQPAVNTHHENHPNCKTVKMDVLELAYLNDEKFHSIVPDTEVIIGSPPCVAFSNSNKSGKGDKSLGLKLLKAYLRIIARKKYKDDSVLKYWVLENVPNIRKYIKDYYTANELDLDGEFELEVIKNNSGVYNAKYYGVPSNRKRFICGDFPTIKETTSNEKSIKTLGFILKYLGNPCENLNSIIKDPNYNFELKSKDISDHHYICEIAKFEWEKAKRHKRDKGYMGKMAFPENLDKPSRTIMATMSASSRESMILQYKDNRYRFPTVREVATAMSFPIDYKFYGNSKSIKYKLVGNAVPPKLSYEIAKTIAHNEDRKVNRKYNKIEHDNKLEFINLNFQKLEIKTEKPKKITARFKYHIPYMIIKTYRVELTNYNSDFKRLEFKWDIEIHKSQGTNRKVLTPSIYLNDFSEKLRNDGKKFCNKVEWKSLSFSTLQENYCKTEGQRLNCIGPYELLGLVKRFIYESFTEDEMKRNFMNQTISELPMAIAYGYAILNNIIKLIGG